MEHRDKSRALSYFRRRSKDYYGVVEKGPLRLLRERERRAVLELAGLSAGRTLIDVGCGNGFYALEAKRAGMRVSALDAVQEMLLPLEGRVDQTFVGDLDHLDSTARYDRVICAGVLDFVENPARAFRNLASLVSPGGRLVVLAPADGLRGLAYRVEKAFSGIPVNGFGLEWFREQAKVHGLSLRNWRRPLPTNLVVRLDLPEIWVSSGWVLTELREHPRYP